MYNTDVTLTTAQPYSCITKAVWEKAPDELGPVCWSNVVVCRKLLLGLEKEITYDYNKFSAANYKNKELLDMILKSLENSKEKSKEDCGKLEIYFRKNFEKNLEKYSLKIFNKIYENADENYLKFILQFVCVLFENNFFDDSFVMIERAVLNVHSTDYLCSEEYTPNDRCEEYTTIIYNNDENVGYELRFKEITDCRSGNSQGKIEKVYIDNETNSMHMFVSHAYNTMWECISVPVEQLLETPYLLKHGTN